MRDDRGDSLYPPTEDSCTHCGYWHGYLDACETEEAPQGEGDPMRFGIQTTNCAVDPLRKQELLGKGLVHAASYKVDVLSITDVLITDLGERYAVYFHHWGKLLHTYFESK